MRGGLRDAPRASAPPSRRKTMIEIQANRWRESCAWLLRGGHCLRSLRVQHLSLGGHRASPRMAASPVAGSTWSRIGGRRFACTPRPRWLRNPPSGQYVDSSGSAKREMEGTAWNCPVGWRLPRLLLRRRSELPRKVAIRMYCTPCGVRSLLAGDWTCVLRPSAATPIQFRPLGNTCIALRVTKGPRLCARAIRRARCEGRAL